MEEERKNNRLERAEKIIDRFKKYDAERKVYIQKLQWDLEEYSEKYLVLKKVMEEYNPENPMSVNLKNLREAYTNLQKAYNKAKKALSLVQDREELNRVQAVLEDYDKFQKAQNLAKLEENIQNLRKTNSELVYRIVQLNKKIEEYENKSKIV